MQQRFVVCEAATNGCEEVHNEHLGQVRYKRRRYCANHNIARQISARRDAETKPWRVKDNPCNGSFGADVIEGFADTTCELPHVAIGLGDVESLLAIMRGSQTNQGNKFRVRNCQVSGMNTVDARLGASRAVLCFIRFRRCGLFFKV